VFIAKFSAFFLKQTVVTSNNPPHTTSRIGSCDKKKCDYRKAKI